MPAISA